MNAAAKEPNGITDASLPESPEVAPAPKREVPLGVRWARMVGVAAGGAMIIQLIAAVKYGMVSGFDIYFAIYGLILMLPYASIVEKNWFYRAYGFLIVSSVVFVFCLMFQFLFFAWDMNALGAKPKLPGLQGTLVFLSLMQVPAVLFQRRPELLD